VTPQELKKALVASGFEVYRTLGDEVLLADRVRDNLIMDSGVRVKAGETLQIRLIMGVRRGQFPSESDAHLFDRVRELAKEALPHGFAEISTGVATVPDPADPARTLDAFFEVVFAKDIDGVEGLAEPLRYALVLAKTAEARR
jgi:hypothetical protein